MDSKKLLKVAKEYFCEHCDYSTCKKSSYDKHISTDKHKKAENDSKMVENDSEKLQKVASNFQCHCGKIYKYDSGYYRHKKKCTIEKQNYENKPFELTNETIINILKQNSDLQLLILEQNKTIIELSKNNSITNSHNNTTNSHNKAFNLNFFLNETCKDAMNITDFVESIKLQLTDLERVGELGYVEGISNIITSKLKALDVTQRPVHCTDKKRETMYVKDENTWEKDEEKKKMHKLVKKVADKNMRLLPEYREKYPDYIKASSLCSDKYNQMFLESFGGSGDNNFEKEEKIIQKVSREVFVDKAV